MIKDLWLGQKEAREKGKNKIKNEQIDYESRINITIRLLERGGNRKIKRGGGIEGWELEGIYQQINLAIWQGCFTIFISLKI